MSISIDMGTAEVKLIDLGQINNEPVINKIYSKATWDDMNTFDPEKLEKANWVGCVRNICNEMKLNPRKIKSLVASISGKNISIKEVTTLDMKEEELFQTLEFEAKKHIPLDGTEAVMDYHILGKNSSEIDKINVLLVATTKNIIQQFDSIIKESGFKNPIFDAEPIALSNCLNHNYGFSEDGIDIVLNIGNSTSTLVVWGNNQTFFTRELDIAGFMFIKDIMKKHGLNYTDAKKTLLENGIGSLGSSNSANQLAENSFSLEMAEKTLINNLIDDIRKSLRYYAKSNNGNSNFKRFFISGGFAELDGLKELIKDELRIETEILNPLNNIACDMKIDNPSKYSVSIGLALRGLI